MGKLEKKYEHLVKAITSFEQALTQHKKWLEQIKPESVESLGIDYQGIVLNLRDSTIQRFEYSIDLLWKYIKTYLEEKLQVVPETLAPKTIIRQACNVKLISEGEAEKLLDMIKKKFNISYLSRRDCCTTF